MLNVNNETNLPTTSKQPRTDAKTFFPCTNLQTSSCQITQSYWTLIETDKYAQYICVI
jgi:hypothetical protein